MKRFWEKVEKTDECWLWKGSIRNKADGYGQFSVGKKNNTAHRFSWELVHGPIPDGAVLLHKCDVPACVRPDHLTMGTQAQNIADKVAKRRQATAEGHPKAKLTWEKVTAIRWLYHSGEHSQRALAKQFGVGQHSLGDIVHGRTWRAFEQHS